MRRPSLAPLILAVAAGCYDNATPAPAPSEDVVIECLPNLDGRLEAFELPVAVGSTVEYGIDRDTPVTLGGVRSAEGLSWSFDSALGGKLSIAVRPLAGAWYQNSFPGGEFVIELGPGSGIDAIYHLDEAGLWLHGLASADDTAGLETVLPYQAPVAVLRFPLTVGDQWVEIGRVDGGTLTGAPYLGTDTYTSEAVAAGRADLPGAEFTSVIRVATRVESAPAIGGPTSVTQQSSFYFECLGEIVRVVSALGENQRDFASADYLLRFSL